MAYLIDGNNLLGRISPEELKNRSGRDGLVVRLLGFQRVKRRQIILVFDGNPESEPTAVAVNAKFTIRYPGEGQSADDVIKDIIRRQKDKRAFYVVSSDREIKEFARSHKLECMNTEDFHRELKEALRERKKQKEMEKRVEDPSPLEIDLWDEVFKSKS